MDMTDKYLEFLRFSIDENEGTAINTEGMDWEGLFEFAYEQTLTGVMYHGIEKLRESDSRPNDELALKWFVMSEKIKKKNITLNMVAAKLTERLGKAGFKSCVLKGQGNALMYPNPYMRNAGDIDIWLDGSKKDIIAFVRKKAPDAIARYHHIDYPIIKDVEIEIHYSPTFSNNIFNDIPMQKFVREHRHDQFDNWVELPEDTGQICRPTDSFNRIFQLSHIMRHYIREGIGIRHFMDYYFLLKRGFTEEERIQDEKTIHRLGMKKMAGGVMYVLKEMFLMDEKYMLVKPNEHVGNKLIQEILLAGNFAKHDERYQYNSNNRLKNYQNRVKHTLDNFRLFPSEALGVITFPMWRQFRSLK